MEQNGQQQNGESNLPLPAGGSGGKTARTESGRTEIQDQRLLSIAMKRKWWKGQRFATDATLKELTERAASGEMSVKDRALLTAMKGLSAGEGRVEQRAVANVLGMERLNQADEFAELGINETEVNVNVTTIGIQTREDFYGNEAHAEASEALEAPGQNLGLGSPVQNGSVRSAMGKNGSGSNGHAHRPRPDAGDVQGGD